MTAGATGVLVFYVVSFLRLQSPVVVLVAAGVISWFLLPTPLRLLVVQLRYGALDSHPSFPSRAASSQGFQMAAAVFLVVLFSC